MDCAPGAGAEDCTNSVHRLWRALLVSHPRRRPTSRRASPSPALRADSGVFVGWADILLDVISGVEDRDAGGMSEDHDRCFSILVLGTFSTGVFNTNALPCINIGADVWGADRAS